MAQVVSKFSRFHPIQPLTKSFRKLHLGLLLGLVYALDTNLSSESHPKFDIGLLFWNHMTGSPLA